MVTTVVVLEILVMGTFALGWLSLLSLRLGFIEPDLLSWLMSKPTQWQVFFAALSLAAVYQLGSVLNTVTYGILERIRGRKIKGAIFAGEYQVARGLVFQHASSHFLQELDSQLRFIRLARSGIVNFTLLGVCALSFGGRYTGLGILSIGLGVLCYPAWNTIYRSYYQEIYSVFKVVQAGQENSKVKAATEIEKLQPSRKLSETPNPADRADG